MRPVCFFKKKRGVEGGRSPPTGGIGGGAEHPPIWFQIIRKKNPFSPP